MKLLKSMAKSFNSNLNFKKFKKDWNKFKKIYKTFLNLSKKMKSYYLLHFLLKSLIIQVTNIFEFRIIEIHQEELEGKTSSFLFFCLVIY